MVKVRKNKPEKVAEPIIDEVILPATRMSDEPVPKQVKWINKQRVLVFATRGVNHRHRHLMEDIRKMMPHHKPESKMERNKNLYEVNEMCEMKNCNKCLLFEGRKMKDLYMWTSNIPNGPSAKFLIENIYTMGELKMTGNSLRGTRPLLSFDPKFEDKPHYLILKELLTQIFGVPNHHPKSQPFVDHVYTFMILDNKIWFRNYQILSEDGALAEIGPRFVLNPIRIFSGSFGGTALWDNRNYISPAKFRQNLNNMVANKYQNRIENKAMYIATKPETGYPDIGGLELFKGDPLEKAKEEIQDALEKSAQEQASENSEVQPDRPKWTPSIKPPYRHTTKQGSKSKSEFSIKRKSLKGKGRRTPKSDKNKKKKPNKRTK